jgi:hypothetical protein
MNPLAARFLIAGAVIVVGGVSIAVSGQGVGEGAAWKGTVVVLAGLGLMVAGWNRRRPSVPPDE